MRIASGVVDQVVSFVAVDATDFTARETGLATFTVYRSRNGGTATAMTTPTVAELDATNMPGVYTLLLDEDMTIGSGNLTESMVFHVTHSGMAPVTLEIELFAPGNYAIGSVTGAVGSVTGAVGSVTGNVGGTVNGLTATAQGNVRTAVGLATANLDTQLADIPTVAEFEARSLVAASYATAANQTTITTHLTDIKGATWASTDSLEAIRDRGDAAWTTATGFSTHSAADVWSVTTRVLTAGTNIALAKGTGVTGFNDLDAAGVRTAVGLASANLDTQLAALPTAAENATAVWGATLTELSADPGASPAASGAVLLPYMAIRNKRDTTATSDEIHNNAGTVILVAAVSDDGVTFSKAEYAAP